MKVNEMLLNQLKMKSRYGENIQADSQTRQVVNNSVEYWDRSSKSTEILERYNVPKTEENKQGIEAFMKNEQGTMSSKLETLEIAASNGVDMTEDNLNSIHEALNEDFSLNESIEVLSVSNDDEVMITANDIENMDLPSNMKNQIMEAIKKGESPIKALANAIGQAFGKKFLGKFGGVLEGDVKVTIRITIEVIEIRYKEEGEDLDLKKLMDQFNALIEAAKNGEGTLFTSAEELISALKNLPLGLASDLEEAEKTYNPDKTLTKEIEDLEEQIGAWVAEALGSVEQVSQDLVDAFEDSPTIKLYVVESVTIKMQDVAKEFKVAQKDMIQTIDRALSVEKPLTNDQIKELLNNVINKLDDILLKSDVPLYTSMTMEKHLLKMSSDLQLARQHLLKDNVADAKNIIKMVRGTLETVVFKPSEKKIQGFALKQSETFLQNKEMMQLQSYRQEGVSARNVLELFRSLGLNHEYEVSEKLSQLKTLEKEMKLDSNLKEVLHKLAQDEKQENKTVETIEKSLNNLNGQQLLNKQGQKNNQQTLFFNIPMVSDQEVKNMKLYVNSRDANNRLDWENCSLYFVIDLKQYGPTGIKVDIKNRGVSITVKNDDEQLKHVIKPLLEGLASILEDVGLKEKDVSFVPLDNYKKFGSNMLKDTPVVEDTAKQLHMVYTDPKKGFDFKI